GRENSHQTHERKTVIMNYEILLLSGFHNKQFLFFKAVFGTNPALESIKFEGDFHWARQHFSTFQ
ncbi:MAG: hypothetical protein AAFU78_20185, partial [Cyanobacteria bacterium J06633_2]